MKIIFTGNKEEEITISPKKKKGEYNLNFKFDSRNSPDAEFNKSRFLNIAGVGIIEAFTNNDDIVDQINRLVYILENEKIKIKRERWIK